MSRTLGIATLVVAAASCASSRSGEGPFGPEAGSPKKIVIEVRNNNPNDVTVYALFAGGRRRLGIVYGHGKKTYTLGWIVPRSLNFEVDVLAGQTMKTFARVVAPGEVVRVTVDTRAAVQGLP